MKKKKPRRHKEAQIERRQNLVFTLWMWGYKITEMAEICRVDARTIYNDLQVIRTWPEEQPVPFKKLRESLQYKIDELMRGARLDLTKIRNPSTRINFSCKIAGIYSDMWRKIMPTEVRLEGRDIQPPIPDDEFERIKKEMERREPDHDG